jgi:tRNA G26 N,N-dimethylase Trm1
MKKRFIIILAFCYSFIATSQQNSLIEYTDSIHFFETSISINSKDNLAPSLYKNGLIYASKRNSGNYNFFYSNLISTPIKIKNTSKVQLGSITTFNNEIYFTGNNKKVSTKGNVNLIIYKGTFTNFKITDVSKLKICNREFSYTDPSILGNGQQMVVATNEKGIPHLLKLTRNKNNEWVKSEVIYISQGYEIVNPYFYDENTVYFSSNVNEGKITHVKGKITNNGFKVIETHRDPGVFNIYKIVRINGKWELPKKVHILNSEFDDLGVVFVTKNSGFINTYRFNNNDNIFYFEIPN